MNQDPYYQNLLKNRWAECRRANMREDRIIATIDSMATQLTAQGAIDRNSQAWPRWGQYVWPNHYIAQNFNDEISYIKGWIHDRLVWMDQQLGFNSGDVDCDGYITAADITALYDYFLKGDTTYIDTSDVDGDGEITSGDITAVYNILMGI